jgi:hypothetical protein
LAQLIEDHDDDGVADDDNRKILEFIVPAMRLTADEAYWILTK